MQLREYLEKREMTGFDFALKCGVSPGAISTIVNKKKKDIALSIALKIHSATDGDVEPWELLDGVILKRYGGKNKRKNLSKTEPESPHNNNDKTKKNKNK